jgi:colanic acid/amylovoran biosynthesis glycosyltransferase
MLNANSPAVAIYRRGFLPLSETFIADHISSLKRYRPLVMADDLVEGHKLPDHKLVLLHGADAGKLARFGHRLTGNYGPLKTFVSHRVDLIHAHFLQDGAAILPFAARRRLPLVVTAHGYDATVTAREHARRTEGLWYLGLQPFMVRYAQGIICVSNWIRDCLLEAGFPQNKLRVIKLGIDATALPQPGSPYHRQGALFVGRLVEKKGVHHLIEAWSKLPRPLQHERLTIIGDGPLMPDLVEQARRLNVPAHFLGARPRAEVFEAMARHRIFAMPSIRAKNGDSEGLPIVLMEAQGMGMAIVAFDDGPMREAIRPGRSGLLARAGDTDEFASHIQRLLQSSGMCEDFGDAGRTHVQTNFDIHASVAELEDYYDEILARQEARA